MIRWHSQPSLEPGFWSVIDAQGQVVALRVTGETFARLIAQWRNDYLHALELLDRAGVWTGADDLLSDRVAALIIERDALARKIKMLET